MDEEEKQIITSLHSSIKLRQMSHTLYGNMGNIGFIFTFTIGLFELYKKTELEFLNWFIKTNSSQIYSLLTVKEERE
jgi:hypothetical protein